jgi:hypothetical protein
LATPDVTKAQLLALVQAGIATLGALGFNLTAGQQTKVMLLSGVVATIVVAADVAIRRGRQKHLPHGVDVPALLEQLAALDRPAMKAPDPPAEIAARARELAAAEERSIADNGPQPTPGSEPGGDTALEPHGPAF